MSYDPNELRSLVNTLLNGTISAPEHARLQQILIHSNDARKEYLACIDIHVGMQELEEEHHDSAISLPLICCPTPERRASSAVRRWALALACLGSAILIVTGSILMPPQIRRNQPLVDNTSNTPPDQQPGQLATPPNRVEPAPAVAHLTRAASAELLLEYLPAIGEPLKVNHEYVLLKGLMELTFENGATVSLKSPSVFTVRSSSLLELKMGNCSVHAPETAKGFEVITPQSRIVDLGTRFNVVTNETGASDVQVVEGAVEVHSPEATNNGSMLLEGEAVRLTNSSPAPQPIPFRQERFVSRFPDRVISYQASELVPGEGIHELKSVTVQRNGQEWTYQAKELSLVDVTHFSSFSVTSNGACLGALPEKLTHLLTDNYFLTSGITNFSRPSDPYVLASDFTKFRERYGMAVEFHTPVVNHPGPDIVIFELQSAAYPASGDPFYVSPIENGPGLRTHLVERFDVTLNSTNSMRVAPVSSIVYDEPIRSLDQMSAKNVVRASKLNMPFYALAVGIDLSDLGYPEGATVKGLFLEDPEDEEHVVVDIVLIGGLPELPTLP